MHPGCRILTQIDVVYQFIFVRVRIRSLHALDRRFFAMHTVTEACAEKAPPDGRTRAAVMRARRRMCAKDLDKRATRRRWGRWPKGESERRAIGSERTRLERADQWRLPMNGRSCRSVVRIHGRRGPAQPPATPGAPQALGGRWRATTGRVGGGPEGRRGNLPFR